MTVKEEIDKIESEFDYSFDRSHDNMPISKLLLMFQVVMVEFDTDFVGYGTQVEQLDEGEFLLVTLVNFLFYPNLVSMTCLRH